jgi:hypothetical protein
VVLIAGTPLLELEEIGIRFLIGGLFVSVFSLLADVLKPKSFAGLLGAAPSVALASLSLTIAKHGSSDASLAARSMIAGVLAFLSYACVVTWALKHFAVSVVVASLGCLAVWFAVAFGVWFVWLR